MFTVDHIGDCTIILLNDTAVSYESENPYRNHDKCNAEFSCSAGQIPEYQIQRLHTSSYSCGWYYQTDYLGLYIN